MVNNWWNEELLARVLVIVTILVLALVGCWLLWWTVTMVEAL